MKNERRKYSFHYQNLLLDQQCTYSNNTYGETHFWRKVEHKNVSICLCY